MQQDDSKRICFVLCKAEPGQHVIGVTEVLVHSRQPQSVSTATLGTEPDTIDGSQKNSIGST